MQTAKKTIIEIDSYGKKLNKELLDLAIPNNPDVKTRAKITSILRASNELMTQVAFDFLKKFKLVNKIFNLLNIFSVSTVISENIKEATLVSSRRWSLKHSSNIIIELPEDNPSKAFYKIVELENKYGFLNERLKKIDLRISDRMIIQLKNKSELLKENDV